MSYSESKSQREGKEIFSQGGKDVSGGTDS